MHRYLFEESQAYDKVQGAQTQNNLWIFKLR